MPITSLLSLERSKLWMKGTERPNAMKDALEISCLFCFVQVLLKVMAMDKPRQQLHRPCLSGIKGCKVITTLGGDRLCGFRSIWEHSEEARKPSKWVGYSWKSSNSDSIIVGAKELSADRGAAMRLRKFLRMLMDSVSQLQGYVAFCRLNVCIQL